MRKKERKKKKERKNRFVCKPNQFDIMTKHNLWNLQFLF